MDQEQEPGRTYSGRGWGFINLSGIRDAPGWLAVPLTVFGVLIVATLATGLVMRAFGSLVQGSPDDIYKILLGLAGVFGAPFVIWRTFVAHQQTVIARESHYTTLFTKAVEQLGATREVVGDSPRTEPNLEVRLGAIYALERIAKDSERDHWPIMEVLCAYVRNAQNCGEPKRPSQQEKEKHAAQWLRKVPVSRVDIQAAITVIGRRPPIRIAHEIERKLVLDFSGANLQRVRFVGNFRGAVFSSANLAKSEFVDCEMKGDELEGPEISGVLIRNSRFDRLELVFTADLVGLRMYGCAFQNALIGSALFDCSFYDCNFSGADFADINFEKVRFSRSNFSNSSFAHSKFTEDCSFNGCNLTGTNLRSADMQGVRSFSAVQLQAASGDQGTIVPPGVAKPEQWDAIPAGESDKIPF